MSAESPTVLEIFLQCLTREEAKTVIFFDFLAASDDYGPPLRERLYRYMTPGEDPSLYVESLRRIIRYLTLECDMWWTGLTIESDGVILGSVIEPRNLHYYGMLSRGTQPDTITGCQTAIRLLQEREAKFDVEILRSALSTLKKAAKRADKTYNEAVDPRTQKEADKLADEALASIGVIRGGGNEDVN